MTMQFTWFSDRCGSIPLAVLEDRRLKLRSKLVLAALASLAEPDGSTQALGKKDIAARAGLPAANLARELRELVKAGWLEIRHQPGANSTYRLLAPGSRANAAPQESGTTRSTGLTEGKLADAPVITRSATVISVTKHGSSWLVSFDLGDGARVGTIFPDCEKPCEPGDTANLKVREWRGRKGIAGGAAAGIEWIKHHPAPPPIEVETIDLVVSGYKSFATPSGLVFASFTATNQMLRAVAMLPARQLPANLTDGTRIRVSRHDGEPIRIGRIETGLELTGDAYLIEPLR